MSPATDLGAGEKERGTIETLLVAPATRGEFVIGKYLVVLLTSVYGRNLVVNEYGAFIQVLCELERVDR